MDGQLGWFHDEAMRAASLWSADLDYSWHIWVLSLLISVLWGSLHADSHSGWTSQPFCQLLVRFLSPHPRWCVMALVHLMTGILTGVRCNPGEVLRCISLMASDAEWFTPHTNHLHFSWETSVPHLLTRSTVALCHQLSFPVAETLVSPISLFSVLMSIHVSQGPYLLMNPKWWAAWKHGIS